MAGNEEGYIKFQAVHRLEELPVFDETEELLFWRNKLWQKGWIGMDENGIGYGNVSLRLKDSNLFLITGTQTGGIAKLEAKHLSLVTEADIGSNLVHSTGLVQASAESLTHAALYKADNQIRSVVHAHNQRTWQQLKALAPTLPATFAYGTPAIAVGAAQMVLEKKWKPDELLVMAGHQDGLLSWGYSLPEAAGVFLNRKG